MSVGRASGSNQMCRYLKRLKNAAAVGSIGAENILFPLLKLLKLKITPRAQCSVPTIKQTQPPSLYLKITNYSLFGSNLTLVVRVKKNFYHSL